MEALRLVWDEAFTGYDFGDEHPMHPIRLELTARLATDLGLLDAAGVHVVSAEPPDDELLLSVHDADYIEAVRRASTRPVVSDLKFGLGSTDNPTFPGMHEASGRICAASREVALAVWSGQAEHGVNFTGGMHHAMPAAASGFCVYNDIGVAIQALLDAGAKRVAYVDVDVHHGDGVEKIFWDDPRVLTISLHENGRVLFPGTGFPEDLGGDAAQGTAVNVALPPGTSDAGWLRAFHSVVPSLLEAFEPEVLVTQQGCDSHVLDPLAHLALSLDCQRASYEALHEFAHRYAGGRWVAFGGGGYEIVDVVPRAWSHLIGIAAHRPIPPGTDVPAGWREYVNARCGRPAPQRMTDGANTDYRSWSTGYDPADAIDRVVLATRKAVFPLHGLDPYFD
ncbi:acetoin utilization protein AcuC [Kineosporia babensis]|uniref:Acetoin utilization protein AcuC n=1 Tax=Kineosporia babensis TaxID=499548 RepID=A0A9X1NDI0_9ACTN|nr:acetoin utilization protein AcuC [Kineosporia babensis]